MQDKLILTGFLLLFFTSAAIGEEGAKAEGTATTPSRLVDLSWEGHSQTPSEELLEFLADWETSSGEWISPGELAKMEILETKDEATHE